MCSTLVLKSILIDHPHRECLSNSLNAPAIGFLYFGVLRIGQDDVAPALQQQGPLQAVLAFNFAADVLGALAPLDFHRVNTHFFQGVFPNPRLVSSTLAERR